MYGETPVYTAASHGHLNVIKTLCNYGADVREGVVKKCLFSTLKELTQSNQVKGDIVSNNHTARRKL